MQEPRPFALDVTLKSPLISGDFYPTLDALLSWVMWNQTGDLERIQELPLARTEGVFHASRPMFYRRPQFFTHSMVKKLSDEDVNLPGVDWGKRTYLNTGNQSTGTPSLMDNRLALVTLAPDGDFDGTRLTYFGCGDMNLCRDMLSLVPGIGKRAHMGMGEIDTVDGRPLEHDRSLRDGHGRPMRPIPLSVWQSLGGDASVETGLETWQPSYHYSAPDRCAIPDLPFLLYKETVDVD